MKQGSQKYGTVPMSSPSLVEGEEWLLQLLRPPNPTLSRSPIQSRVWQMIVIQGQSQSQTLLHDQQRGPKRGPRSPLHGEVIFLSAEKGEGVQITGSTVWYLGVLQQ